MATLFLAGDVMTGRGIDQILPRPSAPQLHEPYVASARDYVALAERVHGPIPHAVGPRHIWGAALQELQHRDPDARIVNLETAVTTSDDAWPGKGIHYRMHPANADVLQAAGVDCCVLANNHVLDWGRDGLHETLATLARLDIKTAGAGPDIEAARQPAVLAAGEARILVFGLCSEDSGVWPEFGATAARSGVWLLHDLSDATAGEVARQLRAVRRPGDLSIASIHWGGNWGYAIAPEQHRFAHRLIDDGGVDVVHGHSSHHAKGIEVHHGKLVLYGCGDFINDYEGISGHAQFRADLALMYFVTLDAASGELRNLALVPLRMRRFRLEPAAAADRQWLLQMLNREGQRLGTQFEPAADDTIRLRQKIGVRARFFSG